MPRSTPRRPVSFRVFGPDGTLLSAFARRVAPRDPHARFAAITKALTRARVEQAAAGVAEDNGVKFFYEIRRGVADVPLVRYVGGEYR